MKKYDIIIAGAGAGGVFMAYELSKANVDAKILMIDKGAKLERRVCPIKAGKTQTCVKCSPCHITLWSMLMKFFAQWVELMQSYTQLQAQI